MKIQEQPKKTNISTWMEISTLEMKVEMLQHHVELCKMIIQEILEDEVRGLAGERYSRTKPYGGVYSRWGENPGSVRIGKEKVRVRVPRVYNHTEGVHHSLESYRQMRSLEVPKEDVVKGIMRGLSMEDYRSVVQEVVESFGLSRSSVSKTFIEESAKQLKIFQNRELKDREFVALFVDGKYLAKQQVIIVLGVTRQGDKIPLDFIQTTTENAKAIGQVFKNLIRRGFRYQQGILCVIDGAKGMEKAIEDVFGTSAVIQRCQWHKRENIVSYLPEARQDEYRRKLEYAYAAETYQEAKTRLMRIREVLLTLNESAVRSLDEGLEYTLTLHRLQLNNVFGKSFSTTNCIENVNMLIERYLKNVKHWKSSGQRHRWVAAALLEIEPRLNKVKNYKHLPLLVTALKEEISKRKKLQRKAA